MSLRSVAAAVVVLAVLVPSATLAWGRLGHHVICRIAWEETSPEARAWIVDLLAVRDADDFARACTWADEVRSAAGYSWTKPQHYVNVKRSRPLDARADCPEQGCVMRAISQQARAFGVQRASRQTRAEALKFIAHYIGDLHQPLHVGYGEDAGGNDIAVRFCPRSCWRSVNNLHQVWDSAMLKAGSPSNAAALSGQLRRDLNRKKKAAWIKGGVIDWARDSYSVAISVAYQGVKHGKLSSTYLGDSPGPARLGRDYTAVMRPAALEQLQKAGVRLADVLDTLARGQVPASLDGVAVFTATPNKQVARYTVVRSASNSSGEVIGRLSTGERAELLGRERSWYRVRLADQTEGYVRAKKVRVH